MSKPKSGRYKTTTVGSTEKIREVRDSINNLKIFIREIIQDRNESLVKPMSVELRKLLSPDGKGNDLLSRLEKEMGIKLIFLDRAKTLPPTLENVSLEEYRTRMIFAIGGRPVTRLELVCIVANEKGAHIDDVIDQMHAISQKVILPLGNPARDRLLFNQNTTYLLTIATTVVKVVGEQLLG